MGLVGFWVRPTREPLYDGVTGSTLFIGLAAAIIFHTFYDFLAFNMEKYPIFGTLLIALMVWAFRLAKKAINEHRDRSPFHPDRLPPREN